MNLPRFLLLKNKSLRFKILLCISVAIFLMIFCLIITMKLDIFSMQKLGESYKSNSELTYFSNELSKSEHALEDYINYFTFESIDLYFSSVTKLENFYDNFQKIPSNNEIEQTEYLIYQLTKSFVDYSNKAISARRANKLSEIEVNFKHTVSCYNLLLSKILELNNLRLQENALSYALDNQNMSFTLTISFGFFLAISIIIFILLYFSITSIMSPLVEISNIADRISNQDFDVPLFNHNSNDEIGKICNAFDRMIISIKQYIDTIWEKARTEAELKEKEIEMQSLYTDAQLRALRNQINPHFLFNTLNTGVQLAMMENADKTCYFLEQVSDFFRYNIQQQKQTATIDEELGLVDNFVYIMKVRFGNRLKFTKIIPQQKFNQMLPVMTLQPLVENCIKYGLKNAIGNVMLKIEAKDDFIEISVSDNGEGMSEEIRSSVLNSVSKNITRLPTEIVGNQNKTGTGLINVFLRLKLQFLRDDIFDIQKSDEGIGTKFIIKVPK